MSPEHADGLDERPLPVAESRQSIAVRVRSGLLTRMAPLHAALTTYSGTTENAGNAALATEATAHDVEAGSESGSASIEGVGEWGVTVVDTSDGGSETEHQEAIIEVDYGIGDGTDPAVVANMLHAIELNEAQLSHEPIPTQCFFDASSGVLAPAGTKARKVAPSRACPGRACWRSRRCQHKSFPFGPTTDIGAAGLGGGLRLGGHSLGERVATY
jgi:hypothetical protein